MTVSPTEADIRVETPSGKGAGDENFPVASKLIAPSLRPHVMAFYDFVRAADDIADNPDLLPDDKVARLDRMEAALRVDGPLSKPRRLAATLAETGITDAHVRAMLSAFRQDATKLRYANMPELWDYCDRSAAPVGRFLVDLHGEDRDCYLGADALSSVLQVLNHIQDCQSDLLALDRVYLPSDVMAAHGTGVADLRQKGLSAGLRDTLDVLLEACAARLHDAPELVRMIKDRRFSAETQVVLVLANRLLHRLRRQDPLAARVSLSKADFGAAGASGVFRFVTARRL